MKTRRLGRNGPEVSAIGLGCYELSGAYGQADEKEAINTVHRALDLGISLLDTADVYGPYINEELVGRAIRRRRHDVVLLTKFGQQKIDDGHGPSSVRINGRPEYVKQACAASLRRLGVDYIDIYIQHRVDPDVPIEETVGALADLVAEGKVRYIGLTEAAAATIRRAHAVHPIALVESEYSLWTRDPEIDVLKTLDEIDAGFIAFSPLGRGFLTGKLKSPDDLADGDARRAIPRFDAENFRNNQALLDELDQISLEVGITTAQLALAWLLSRSPFIVPIPGTKRPAYVEQNAKAVDVVLSQEMLRRLDQAMPRGVAAGERYSPEGMSMINR